MNFNVQSYGRYSYWNTKTIHRELEDHTRINEHQNQMDEMQRPSSSVSSRQNSFSSSIQENNFENGGFQRTDEL